MLDADRTLTSSNGVSDESRNAVLVLTSSVSLTATRNLVVPTVNKFYAVRNATTGSQSVVVKTSAGTGVTLANGYTQLMYCDGTNVVLASVAIPATGVLSVPNGGTGSATLTANNVLLGNGTSAVQAVAPGTTGNVLTSNGTTWTSAAAAPTNGYRRNRFINGAMQVDQRNAGAAQTITTASAYTVDRWIVFPVGASATGQRVAGPSGYQYAYQLTGAAGVTSLGFQQRIESQNVADLINQNVTLSATISNSLLTTVTWSAYYANAVDNYSSITLIASGTFTVTSTATQYTATFNAGANAGNGILINFNVGAQTSGTFTVTGVQLEAGSVATPFERLSIGETLALCQRYYQTYSYNIVSGFNGPGGGVYATTPFNTQMRIVPSQSSTVIFSSNASLLGNVNISDNTATWQTVVTTSGFGFQSFSFILSAEL